MAENQVDEVKSRTDIVSVIGERIELKKAGRNYKAACPFHGEKTPSFMVSPELQIFKCFGCGEAGDVFSFLEKYEGMEFGEALRYLADKAGVKLQKFTAGASSEKEKLIEINTLAMRFYNYLLLNHPVGKRALEYLLKDRGLKRSTVEEFQLGFSPENSSIIKKFLVDKKRFNPKEIEMAGVGVSRGADLYDRFNGRVIFPLFDHRGNVIGFAGRVLPWDKRETGKYINSPETAIYHKSSVLYGLNLTRSLVKKKKVAIVVEGELDAISSYQAGVKNVVAIKGSALTEDQVRLLSRFAPKFILALDSDFAGDAAARRGISIAGKLGVEVKVAKISKFKDPDEAARGDIESYKKDLISAEGVYDFLIDSVFSRFDSSSGAGKAKISKELVPILAEIDDKIVQAHFANLVAQKLNVPLEAVTDEILKIGQKETSSAKEAEELKPKSIGRRELLEERFLTLAFSANAKILDSAETLKLITTPLYRRIVEEYRKFMSSNKTFSPKDFGKGLPPELFEGFSRTVLGEDEGLAEKPDEVKKELDLVRKELKILVTKEELKSLAVKIRKLETGGDKEQLLKAQNQFNKLAATLGELDKSDKGGIILSEP
jgi:DNA primase